MKKALLFAFLVLTSGLLAFGQKIYWETPFLRSGTEGGRPSCGLYPRRPIMFGRRRPSSSLSSSISSSGRAIRSMSSTCTRVRSAASARFSSWPPRASPRPSEAAKSGKTVVYLEGNIHPYESEAKEALLLLTREILLGQSDPSPR
ncbi:MAG: hypothetical protein M0C28_45770 [Candidatus Moduliflexus flocculans]|nr:hypothetical protein [Candidatus Moduliflexus flocculans]